MKKLLVQGLLVVFLSLFLYSCSEENHPPALVILATPSSGNAPLSVQCRAEASDPDNNPLAFEWDFGDGSARSNEQNPAHIFMDTGVFTATCTVTDNGSPPKSTSKTVTITVSAPSPTLSALKPAWKVAHLPEFTLTVTGTNFIPSSRIVFNEVEKTVEFLSSSEIRCHITPEDTNVFSGQTPGSSSLQSSVKSESLLGVWVRNPSPGGDSQPLNFTVRSNHTFSTPELICSDFSESYSLLINRYLYLIYRPNKFDNMKLMISKDNGKTWLPAVEIPHSSDDLIFSFAVDNSGTLYCVNLETGSEYADIMLAKSTNGGITWTENRLICAGTQESGLCNHTAQNVNIIALNDDSLHVIWMEHGIECAGSFNYYIRSTDHGETWSERRKTPDAGTINTYYPTLLGNGYGTLHYISYIGGSYEYPTGPFYQYSTDNGLTWPSSVLIQPSLYAPAPKIPYPGPNDFLYLPYLSTIHYVTTLAAQVSKDHGQSWKYIHDFGYMGGSEDYRDISFSPDIAGNLHVFWAHGYGSAKMAVYYSRKINMDDLYEMWGPSPATAISPAGYMTDRDSYAIDDEGNLYMVWQSTTKPNRLYFVRSDRDE